MPYKLIALDIDGTIRERDGDFSDRIRASISDVIDSGALVTLVTGRTFESAREICSDLDIRTPVVTYQGAHVADPLSGSILLHRTIDPSTAVDTLSILELWKGDVAVYQGGCVYVTRISPWVKGYGKRNPGTVHVVRNFDTIASLGPTRLLAVGQPDDVIRLVTMLREEFRSRLYITRSLPQFCEILHPKSYKQAALEWLAKYLRIKRVEIVAFGNSQEDISMLSWAGLGVAVSGATSEVIDSAEVVAPSLENDGVAHVLNDLLDRGLIG